MIYGGSWWGFFLDPKMPRFPKAKWKAIVKAFFEKYYGLKNWQDQNIKLVCDNNGVLVLPTGRKFKFVKSDRVDGVASYPENCIKNYPVQGLGADVVQIARISLFKRIKEQNIDVKLVNTIHDSIIIDTPSEMLYNIVSLANSVFTDLPTNLSKMWEVNWDIPISVEFKTLDGKEIK